MLNQYDVLPCGKTAIEVICAALRAFGVLKPGRLPAQPEVDALIPYLEEVLKDEKVSPSYGATVANLVARASVELAPRYPMPLRDSATAAVSSEREQCAKIADACANGMSVDDDGWPTADYIASAIRARSEDVTKDEKRSAFRNRDSYMASAAVEAESLKSISPPIFSLDELGKAVYEKHHATDDVHHATAVRHVEWRVVLDKDYWIGLGRAAIDFYLKQPKV